MSESIWEDPRITAYVLGEMPEPQRHDFEIEMETNPELAAAVEEARTVTDQLASLYGDEAIPSLGDERRAAIVATGAVLPALVHPPSSWRIGLVLVVAAALLLIVGVAPLMYRQHQETKQVTMTQRPAVSESIQTSDEESLPLALRQNARKMELELRRLEQVSGRRLRRVVDGSRLADSQGLGGQQSEMQLEFVPELGQIVVAGPAEVKARSDKPVEREEDKFAPTPNSLAANSPASDFPGISTTGADRKLQESDGLARATAMAAAQNPVVGDELSTQLGIGRRLDVVKAAGKLPELVELQRRGVAVDYGLPIDEGRGPGVSGDRFEPITDNPFRRVSDHPLSTFSVDVDTASYSKVRDFLMRANQLPRPDAVRIEELVNYFHYDYEPPADSDEHPFAARVSVTSCPWNDGHRLARIALQGKTMEREDRPQCNLVFLLDTSGSMNAPNKLPLVIEGMQLLLKQLNDQDQVAITVYAGSAGLVLDSTAAKKKKKIRKALTELAAGGSTNGGAGIALAYQTARDHFIPNGVNRVILCTDGDFNVGTTGTDELVRLVEREAKGGVFLSVLGFGMGNHNDAMLEQLSGRGNGNYSFIDSREEARKVLVEQTSGTLVTIAKDVKLQIEFNPTQVSSYRLIGYENRVLAKEDFNDDKKDAGEIGAGHSVTALYEIVPAEVDADANPPKVDDLKYQQPSQPSEAADSEELLTLKFRYKQPDGDTSTLVEFPVVDKGGQFAEADDDVRFAAAVASFGMQLRRSPYAGSWTMSDAMNIANQAKGEDRDGLRAEFVTLVQKASELMGEE